MRRLNFVDAHHHNDSKDVFSISFAGVHPWEADKVDLESELRRVEQTALQYDAVGEIGLDFVCNVAHEKQEDVFRQQLCLAQRLNKMVVVHSVKSFDRTMELLGNYKLPTVIMHGFVGSREQMKLAASRKYMLSYGERTILSPKTSAAFRSTPEELILVESDTSKRDISLIYNDLAEIRGMDIYELRDLVFKNYNRIFYAK